MIRVPHSILMAALVLGGAASTSCIDPVHSDDVDALGGEVKGVREGPNHRPGQPCLVCHGGKGPGSPEFEIAGTIYLTADNDAKPAADVTIQITDVAGTSFDLVSNQAGNFYLEKDRKTLYYPLTVLLKSTQLELPKETPAEERIKEMITPIGRNGGCGFCHVHNIKPEDKTTHMPHVYLNAK